MYPLVLQQQTNIHHPDQELSKYRTPLNNAMTAIKIISTLFIKLITFTQKTQLVTTVEKDL